MAWPWLPLLVREFCRLYFFHSAAHESRRSVCFSSITLWGLVASLSPRGAPFPRGGLWGRMRGKRTKRRAHNLSGIGTCGRAFAPQGWAGPQLEGPADFTTTAELRQLGPALYPFLAMYCVVSGRRGKIGVRKGDARGGGGQCKGGGTVEPAGPGTARRDRLGGSCAPAGAFAAGGG